MMRAVLLGLAWGGIGAVVITYIDHAEGRETTGFWVSGICCTLWPILLLVHFAERLGDKHRAGD